MTRKEMHRFERVLTNVRTELVQSLEKSVDRLVIAQCADPMDQIRDTTEQDVESRTISHLTVQLRDLDSALRAIQEGTFGRCAACDDEIALKRLQAIPWSCLCLQCQEKAEAAGRPEIEKAMEDGYALVR